MKKTILALCLLISFAVGVSAQNAESKIVGDASTQTAATVAQNEKILGLEAGTRLTAELQNTIDVRKARVGDQVVLRTTQAIKSNGKTIVGKGAKLIGHVTEVAQKTKENGQSHVAIVFDHLEHGSLSTPISATISSLTNIRARAAMDDGGFGSSADASSSARTTTSASSGGLLGGVVNSTTSTVGSAVGGTTAAVGSTVNSTTNAVGATTAGVGRSLGSIQISEASSTSVDGDSQLSLRGGNLRLEKGTSFNLVVTQSARAGTEKEQ